MRNKKFISETAVNDLGTAGNGASLTHQEWLFSIAERARTATDAQELLFEVAEATGRHLGAHRCLFNEIDLETNSEVVHRDYCRDADSVAGTHPVSGYSPVTTAEMEAGRTVVNKNSRTDPRTAQWFDPAYDQARELAYVAVPLMRTGKWVASLWISDDKPRDWTADEIQLLETVAERTWTAVERLRAEEERRASEERYRMLFNSIDSGFCTIRVLFDESGKAVDYVFLEVNPSFERHTGIKDAIGKRMLELSPGHEAHWFETYGRIALTGEPERFVSRADQLGYWYDVYAFRVGRPEDREVAVLFNDVTARKQTEDAASFLASIVEYSDDAIISKDLDGVITTWNKSAERLFGYTAAEAVGRPVTMLIPPDRQSEEPNILRRIRSGRPVDHYETVRMRKDGATINVSLSVSPIKNAEGRIIGAAKIARDITDRKRSEADLHASETKFANFMTNLPGLAWIKDLKGRYVYANDAAVNAFRVERTELYTRTDDEVFSPATARVFKENDRQAVESENGIQTIEVLEDDAGVPRYAIVSKFPIFGMAGMPVLVGGIAIDITDQKKTEEDLRRTNDELTRFNRLVVGRELRMIELKEEINALCEQAGEPARYKVDFGDDDKK